MSFLQEFKKFISRGNVIDMAVGIVLGASFTKIVEVLVAHVLMPPIGLLIAGVDFSKLKITLKSATENHPAVTLDIGLFINSLINFFIIGMSVFVLVKLINKLYLKREMFTKQNCPECKMEIPLDASRCGHCTALLKNSNLTK